MRTLSEIIVKRDYSQKSPSSVFYKDSPFWQKLICICYVGFIALAALGDWKTLQSILDRGDCAEVHQPDNNGPQEQHRDQGHID